MKVEEIPQFKYTLLDHNIQQLITIPNPTVLEIGCNDGSETERFTKLFPTANLICFEPEPRAIEKFKKRNVNATLHQIALGAEEGHATFHQSGGSPKKGQNIDWDMSGSLKKPTGHLEYSPWCKFKNQIQVKVFQLDAIMEKYHPEVQSIDLIWMDVQGGERDVILGGQKTLQKTKLLYAEFGHWKKPLYEGQMNLEETILCLGPNWTPMGVYENCNVLAGNKTWIN